MDFRWGAHAFARGLRFPRSPRGFLVAQHFPPRGPTPGRGPNAGFSPRRGPRFSVAHAIFLGGAHGFRRGPPSPAGADQVGAHVISWWGPSYDFGPPPVGPTGFSIRGGPRPVAHAGFSVGGPDGFSHKRDFPIPGGAHVIFGNTRTRQGPRGFPGGGPRGFSVAHVIFPWGPTRFSRAHAFRSLLFSVFHGMPLAVLIYPSYLMRFSGGGPTRLSPRGAHALLRVRGPRGSWGGPRGFRGVGISPRR